MTTHSVWIKPVPLSLNHYSASVYIALFSSAKNLTSKKSRFVASYMDLQALQSSSSIAANP